MHPHLPFSVGEILWTLTFAAQLVLLVVLLGRERVRRFPWFTASIVTVALHLLLTRVLNDKLPRLTLASIVLPLDTIGAVIGLGVLVELARKAFGGTKRWVWITGAIVMLAVGGVVLRYWGVWPPLKTMTLDSGIAVLRLLQLITQKGEVLTSVLTIQLCLLAVLFGRSRGAGWRSHTQRILVGLSTAALAQLSVQVIIQLLATHVVPKTRPEYEHLLDLADRIANADKAIYFMVLLWWIACLWKDDPGAAVATLANAGSPKIETAEDTADASEIAAEADQSAENG